MHTNGFAESSSNDEDANPPAPATLHLISYFVWLSHSLMLLCYVFLYIPYLNPVQVSIKSLLNVWQPAVASQSTCSNLPFDPFLFPCPLSKIVG